jgi:phospholipase A1
MRPKSGNLDPDYIALHYNNIEAKFQALRLKSVARCFWGHGDLWLAYTQKSHWQIYNNNLSPFREVNYEPELILNFPVKFNLFGFKARMVGAALNHESNGK